VAWLRRPPLSCWERLGVTLAANRIVRSSARVPVGVPTARGFPGAGTLAQAITFDVAPLLVVEVAPRGVSRGARPCLFDDVEQSLQFRSDCSRALNNMAAPVAVVHRPPPCTADPRRHRFRRRLKLQALVGPVVLSGPRRKFDGGYSGGDAGGRTPPNRVRVTFTQKG